MSEPESGAVITEGVTSEVVQDGETVGHVLLLDYDDGAEYLNVIRETSDLPGFTAVLESSPGSFHVWNLTVRSLEETALEKLRLRDDDLHAGTGYRAGRWVVRIGPKRVYSEGEERPYKPAPKLRDMWYTETDREQSESHLSLLSAEYEKAEGVIYEGVSDGVVPNRVGGEGLNVSQYMTATDDVKKAWRDGDAPVPDGGAESEEVRSSW